MECFRWLWAEPEVCCPFGAAFARILAEVKEASSEDGPSLPEEASSIAEEVEEDKSMTALQDLPIGLLIEIRHFITVSQGFSDLGKVSSTMMEVEGPFNLEDEIPAEKAEASFNFEDEIPEEKVVRSAPRRFLSTRRAPATPVFLNVYDVAADAQWLNGLFANFYSPVRFGGAFHVGLQVGSEEWAFGYTKHGTGVYRTMPRSLPHFRESVELRLCWMRWQGVSVFLSSQA
ncbi:unnamed protein product [Symbiodinium natans]|uniref:PPPDE domain-containing protein n=1 Tax=Symbiodinium natans TaxID=878477 RepID=A0A812TRU2_9DINO|nr:unnamed protein product [Symbiodinium natans]